MKDVAGLTERATVANARGRCVSFSPNPESECSRAKAEKSASSASSSSKRFRETLAILIAPLKRSAPLRGSSRIP
ncbi:MAG TPA: hypothetical protein VM163_02705, partial [bacterium]|nr:hypothetical protein [bacterium]